MSDLQEILDAQQKQGVAWEEFKTTNDARMKLVEGKANDNAPADMLEKLGAINTDLSALGKDIADIKKKQIRAALAGDRKELNDEQAEHKSALGSFLRTGKDDGLKALEQKAMNFQSDPNGGYLVDEEMDSTIDRVAQVISAMPRIASVVTINSPVWQRRVMTAGMAMRRVANGATGGETTEPTYSLIQIPVYPCEVEPWVQNEMLEDSSFNLESYLTEEAAIGFSEGLSAEYITGDGVGECRGITSYTNVANASYVWGKVGYIASGKSATFASVAPSDAFINLQHGLKAQYRPGAVWLMNDTTLGVARQMKDASGSYYLWNPDPLAGFGGRFLGSVVEIDDNMPALASNSYSVAYGNFQRAYTIVNRSGTSMIRDNITAKGTTKFNFRRRTGAAITNFEAIKLMKFASS